MAMGRMYKRKLDYFKSSEWHVRIGTKVREVPLFKAIALLVTLYKCTTSRLVVVPLLVSTFLPIIIKFPPCSWNESIIKNLLKRVKLENCGNLLICNGAYNRIICCMLIVISFQIHAFKSYS